VADAILFGNTNAASVSSFMVMVGFILLILTFYYLIYGLISLSQLYGIRINRKRQAAIYATSVLGVVVALQSSGELGSRDVWVLLPLAVLGYFYSSYARNKPVV
jgi:hypothetical protein